MLTCKVNLQTVLGHEVCKTYKMSPLDVIGECDRQYRPPSAFTGVPPYPLFRHILTETLLDWLLSETTEVLSFISKCKGIVSCLR